MLNFSISQEVPSKKNRWHISKYGGIYQDKKVKDFVEFAQWELRSQYRGKPITDNVELELEFYNKRDKDVDNQISTIMDMIQGILIENDRKVIKITASKHKSDNRSLIFIGCRIKLFERKN